MEFYGRLTETVRGLPGVENAALMMALVSLLASYLPARRASRINPIEALMAE